MAEDWWSAASASAASLLNQTASFARLQPTPPQPTGASASSDVDAAPAHRRTTSLKTDSTSSPCHRRSASLSSASADPLLTGLSRAAVTAPNSALPAPRSARAFLGGSGVPSIVLYELVERATGHSREGNVDAGALRRVLAHVRSRVVTVAEVLRALVAGSDGLADAPYNASVLHFVHLLLAAGPRALQEASAHCGGRGPPALKVVADVHRAARRGGDDVLSSSSLRFAIEAAPVPEGRPSLAAGVELYALLLSRRIAFAGRAPEAEANYSLDRFYRRLGIENRAESARIAVNNDRLARLLSSESRAELLGIVRVAVATLDALRRGRASGDIIVTVLAEACNAYVFAEYVRAKCGSGGPPRGEARQLRDVALAIAGEWKRDSSVVVDGDISSVLARVAQVDDAVAAEVLAPEGPGETPRSVRIESRHRRDIVCSFSSFAGLHAALDPGLKFNTSRLPPPQRTTG